MQVIIHITDENDCSPEFQQSIYSQDNVLESVPVGTSLLQGKNYCLPIWERICGFRQVDKL